MASSAQVVNFSFYSYSSQNIWRTFFSFKLADNYGHFSNQNIIQGDKIVNFDLVC